MDVARNSAKRKIEGDAAEDKLHKSKDQKEPKRRRIEIPAGPAAPPAAPSSIQPTTSSSPPKPKVHKRRNASPSTSSIAATRPISSSPRVQDTRRERVLATTATVATAPSKHDSPSPSGSSPQPSTPPINRPPIKFATPQRNLTLKQRASDSTGSPTAATATADSTSPKPTTPERPSATRFRVADRFVATSSSPRSTTSGSLAPPNLGELTRMLRSSQSSSPSSTTSPSSQLLSSSPFKQLRLTSPPSSSSSSYSSSSSLLPTSSSSSFASTHQRSPEKQLSSTVAQEMRRFRRTQETRVRNFQAEVRQGLSPFRGRKLFPEPEIDDDAILPPIVKPEPRDEEDTDNNHNHNHSEEQDHHPLHHTEAAGLVAVAAKTTGQEERHSCGCAHNSSDAVVLD